MRWKRWPGMAGRTPGVRPDLVDADAAVARSYEGDDGRTNPFLHLAMHLSISEQCSIDQPRGIRQAVELLAARRNSLHDAHHAAMECLGRMLWESQRSGQPPTAPPTSTASTRSHARLKRKKSPATARLSGSWRLSGSGFPA